MLSLFLLVLSPALAAPLSTVPAWSETSLPGEAYEVRWGDGDGDGDLDLVVLANEPWTSEASIVYFRNDGALSFVEAGAVAPRSDALVTAIAFEDMDGDGLPDLVADGWCEDDATPDLVAWRNTGGSLLRVYERTTCRSPSSLAAADFDGDGALDLVESTTGYPHPVIGPVLPDPDVGFRNTGAALRVEQDTAGAFSHDVAASDWDGDGRFEVVFARGGREAPWYADGAPDVVYEVGPGGFVTEWTSPESESSASVAWGDFDGDGDLDLAVGGGQGADDKVYENTGAGLVLAHRLPKPAGVDLTWSVDFADIDGDGSEELALGHVGAPRVVSWNGAAFVEVWSGVIATSAWQPDTELRFGDADGDGDPDLAMIGRAEVHVFENL